MDTWACLFLEGHGTGDALESEMVESTRRPNASREGPSEINKYNLVNVSTIISAMNHF